MSVGGYAGDPPDRPAVDDQGRAALCRPARSVQERRSQHFVCAWQAEADAAECRLRPSDAGRAFQRRGKLGGFWPTKTPGGVGGENTPPNNPSPSVSAQT